MLSRIGGADELDPIAEALKSSDPQTVNLAASMLVRAPDPRFLPRLKRCLNPQTGDRGASPAPWRVIEAIARIATPEAFDVLG